MRLPALAVAALLVVAACHRPRPVSIRDRLRSLVAAARPVAVRVDVKAVLKQASHVAADRAIDHAARRAERPPARRIDRQPDPSPSPSPSPAPAPAPVPVHIDRTDAAKPTVFVMRWQTRGGKASCEVHATQDACSSACTALLRSFAFEKPDDTTPQGCTCLEQAGGC